MGLFWDPFVTLSGHIPKIDASHCWKQVEVIPNIQKILRDIFCPPFQPHNVSNHSDIDLPSMHEKCKCTWWHLIRIRRGVQEKLYLMSSNSRFQAIFKSKIPENSPKSYVNIGPLHISIWVMMESGRCGRKHTPPQLLKCWRI